MTKRKLLHTLGLCAVLALLTTGIALVLKAGEGYRARHGCEAMEVHLRDSLRFVTPEEVQQRVALVYGSYIGKRLDSLDLYRIEEVVDAQSAVLRSEAYTTPDGKLHVDVWQRRPVIRFQNGADGFYADSRGSVFPLQDHFSCDVPIVDGRIPVDYTKGYKGEVRKASQALWIQDVIALTEVIEASPTWRDFIVQMSVNGDGDLVLVPREGSERFIFGRPEMVRDKLAAMEKYYQYVRPSVGDNYYKTVNVKYKGQIVCRKQ